MCGIAGYYSATGHEQRRGVLERMLSSISHRGPDSEGIYEDPFAAIGFRRLSFVDLAGGDQPLYNEDRSLVLVCNGEIYNHIELRKQLEQAGHRFTSRSDVEVILHLYEDVGADFVNHLNGQFALVLYDSVKKALLMARDHAGIAPLYYSVTNEGLIFASEAKALLCHPSVPRQVDLVGLDQVICFPGVLSPRTFFKGISALPPGCILQVGQGTPLQVERYWHLQYPLQGEYQHQTSEHQQSAIREALFRSISTRMAAEVPVGFYLSGGLDSSLIACIAHRIKPGSVATFSVVFEDANISEKRYQRLIARQIGSQHYELNFNWKLLDELLPTAISQGEVPIKETYNACSLALSGLARGQGIKAILTGEGADELFAGYPGYKFDALAARSKSRSSISSKESQVRHALWGCDAAYERTYSEFSELRMPLYSSQVKHSLAEESALSTRLIDGQNLVNRHAVHQRSCLDFGLRLADHLLTEHGDRMLLHNSVEGRYPFLDQDFVRLATQIAPEEKLSGFDEKRILKKIADGLVPKEIVVREKYGFHAPGSPWLLRNGTSWVRKFTSPELISRQGIFDVEYVNSLVNRYSSNDFQLDARSEDDFLMVVISTGVLVESFGL